MQMLINQTLHRFFGFVFTSISSAACRLYHRLHLFVIQLIARLRQAMSWTSHLFSFVNTADTRQNTPESAYFA